jgi:hypothetical protein
MPQISNYPTITPATGDLVILSDTSGSGNSTKTATAGSIAELAEFSFTKTSITNVQLRAMGEGATPVTLVAAPGAGKIVVPFKVIVNLTSDGVAMTTNTNLVILQNQAVAHLYEWDAALGVTTSQAQEMAINSANMARYANTSTVIAVENGNPTHNNSVTTIDVYIYYRTLTL